METHPAALAPPEIDLPAADIRVGHRHRGDLGDLAGLARSIKEVGLLHPLVVTPDLQLVAGARRLAAVKQLGWENVPVRVVEGLSDALAALRAERDENTCRKDFTRTEAVALGKALEELERAGAKERQQEGGKAGGKASGNLPEASKGQTRDKVAEAVGMSGKTYEKAKAVVEAAEKEPEKYGDLARQMDETGKVDPAHREMKERGGAAPQGGWPDAAGGPLEQAKATAKRLGLVGLLDDLRNAKAVLAPLAKENPLGKALSPGLVAAHVRRAAVALERGIPYKACLPCEEAPKEWCEACHGRGWVSRSVRLAQEKEKKRGSNASPA